MSSGMLVVAALQYGGGGAHHVDPACEPGDDNCAVEALIRRAHAKDAKLIVVPEYGLDQSKHEPEPELGARPSAESPLQQRFGKLAEELGVYLVINLETKRHLRPRNTQVAFGPDGTVVGKHHKFELFDHERRRLEPGTGVMAFETPYGRIGLLICADMYGDPRLHARLTSDLGADIVAVSSRWTVEGAARWPAAFAHDWGVHVVAANASRDSGRGGGVFAPDGPVVLTNHDGHMLSLASIPLPDSAVRDSEAPVDAGDADPEAPEAVVSQPPPER